MNVTVNVLIFPSGSMVAKEIYDALKYEKYLTLYGTDYDQNNFSAYYFEHYISGCPMIEDEVETVKFLRKLVQEKKIKYIFPAFDKVLGFLKQHESMLGATIMAPDLETIKICDSKLLTYQLLQSVIPTPHMYHPSDPNLPYPMYSKSITGYGSHGHRVIYNPSDLVDFNPETHLLLEYLLGHEYTVDCFSNQDGRLLYCYARQRSKILNEMSIHSQTVKIAGIQEYAEAIQSKIRMTGLWFFHVKYDRVDGSGSTSTPTKSPSHVLKLLEVGYRVSGTMCVNRVRGVNFPLLAILDAENQPIEPVRYNNISVDCYKIYHNHYKTDLSYQHVYCDLDDTLIINGKVNLQLVSFLYQCLNHKKGLTLLTRNQQAYAVLDKFRLNLFDQVIKIPQDKIQYPKSGFITNVNSILIDDSYIERLDVSIIKGIPCLSPSDVELLGGT